MRTFTLAEAARLVGTSRGTLYRAIKAGRLICTSAGGPGKESVITEDALRQAGYRLLWDETHLEHSHNTDGLFYATSHDTSRDTSRPVALEQRVERLERYMERLDGKVELALELLKAWGGQHAPTPVLPMPAAVAIPPRTATRPLSQMRQQIVDLLRQHPEGMSPAQVRQALRTEKSLADTMGGMARDGILKRVKTGRYVVVRE
jgi:excisionase family DNA binding protein